MSAQTQNAAVIDGIDRDAAAMSASGPEPFATNCTPTEVTLKGVRSGADAVFTWVPVNALFTITQYSVFRSTTAANILGTPPYTTTLPTVKTFTDPETPTPILFYTIMPSTSFFTLDWPGPYMVPAEADQNDDGFKSVRDFPYSGAPEDVALSGDPAEFWVDVRSMLGCIPSAVELLVDRNDDGDFGDAGEVVPMAPLAPGEPTSADSLYFVRLDDEEPLGTVPSTSSTLYSRDSSGNIRWARADATGTLNYQFRAWDATAYAGGPAAAGTTFTLLNTAAELIDDLGKPVVVAGNCGYDTDWETALVYFEEAEGRLAPPSPYNQAADPDQHPDLLSAQMASVIAETAHTIRNYDTLFQGNPGKLYRAVMLDWIAFADEQTARLDAIATHAPSAPDPASWKLDFPRFCIFTEEGAAPFAATQALAPLSGSGLPGVKSALPFGLVPAPANLATSQPAQGLRAPEPIYIFGDNDDAMAEWDRSDAYLLKSLSLSIHAAAVGYRLYEAPSAHPVLVSDLDWIETALRPEEDAEAHAECNPEPCPPLNGDDDDDDGLDDDLGFAARVIEMFPGLGIYTQDGALTLEAVADDSSAIIDSLREGMRLVLKEADNQIGTGDADRADATLVFGPDDGIPTTFEDDWSYLAGEGTPDGLPDLAYAGDDILPVAWCEEDGIQHAPPMDIQGGLGDDIDWWTDQMIEFYNEYSGEPPLAPECYPQAWAYTVFACDWGWQWQKAVRAVDPVCFNFRDDIERLLTEYDIDPADLGPDFLDFLDFLECIDVRAFIDAPENVREYLPFTCADNGFPPADNTAPACDDAGTYTFNGFLGDWNEPLDPIVSGKFWTIEPFSTFNTDDHGIPVPACVTANLSTDPDCIALNWDDRNGNGTYDLFEPVLMANASTPLRWIDLNNDGQWNGWTDEPHLKVSPAVYGPSEPANPGDGLYNGLYVYFKDPTFGGQFPEMTNEDLNNFIGTAAGWADGALEFPFDNQHPLLSGWTEDGCGGTGNYCFHITASDPDAADVIHYKLVAPSGVTILKDGLNDGIFRLNVPAGTWGLIGLVYDNVNNLNDLAGRYVEVTR